MHGRGHVGQGACMAGGHVRQRVCIVGGMYGRGHVGQEECMAGGVHGGGACMADTTRYGQ